MAAPEYIGILKEYPGSFFWAGLILAALLIGAAIIIALRGEASPAEWRSENLSACPSRIAQA
jgi:hypothetical protein